MNENSNISNDLSAHAARRHPVRSPIASWRRVFIALALALTVGSAGQPPPAQAAPARAKYAYFVFATLPKSYGTICVGDKVPISVNVVRTSTDIQTDSMNISGIWVAGSVQDPGIGKLIVARKETGFDYEQPGTASFIFHADKPGKTTLTFNAEIRYYQSTILKWIYGPAKTAVSNLVSVTVEDCKYEVTAISQWITFGLNYKALIVGAGLTADAPGHYTGTATVYWVNTISQPPPCSPTVITYTSQADLTGSMDADGQHLVVDVISPPVKEDEIIVRRDDCKTEAGEVITLMTPDPLTFSVPASGGGHTLSQVLTVPGLGILSGTAKVSVVPVTSH